MLAISCQASANLPAIFSPCVHCGAPAAYFTTRRGVHFCAVCAGDPTYCAADFGAPDFIPTTIVPRLPHVCHRCHVPLADLDYETASGAFICEDCAKAFFLPCDECGFYFPRGIMTDALDSRGNGVYICPDCRDSEYAACDCCGCYVPEDTLRETADGDMVCETCQEEDYFYCEDCEELIPRADACVVHNERGEDIYVCEDCRDRHFTRCDDCREYFPDDAVFRTVSGDHVCEDCRENYCFCERCRELVPDSDIEYIEEEGGYFCSTCAAELDPCGERLHEYGYKPSPRFHHTDADVPGRSLFFGIELELSHASREDCGADFSACHDILNPSEDAENIYTKKDSTLERGFEIVSHPRTLSSWHEFAPTLQEYFDQAAEYTRGDRDGLHVHISRKGMTEAHALRFGAFINACQDELMPIARRRSEWGAYADKPKTGAACKCLRYTGNRYRAVNWCNAATVELRIFRATIDLTEFMAAVEFSHAAYQFTKRYCNIMQLLRGEAWPAFLAYLRDNAEKYGALISLLRDSYGNPAAPRPEFFAALGKEKRAAA